MLHDPRINTLAAIAVVSLFGIGALVVVEHAITKINWMYVSIDDTQSLN